jgi:hypothetical protein
MVDEDVRQELRHHEHQPGSQVIHLEFFRKNWNFPHSATPELLQLLNSSQNLWFIPIRRCARVRALIL